MDKYNVAVTGFVLPGHDAHSVLNELELLFKVPQLTVEPLLRGERVIIKRDLDGPTADRYVMRLRDCGIGSELERAGAPRPAPTLATFGVDPPPVPESAPSATASAIPVASQSSPSDTPMPSKSITEKMVIIVGCVLIGFGAFRLLMTPSVTSAIGSFFLAAVKLLGYAMAALGGGTATIAWLMYPKSDRRFTTGYKENRSVTWEGLGIAFGIAIGAAGLGLLKWTGAWGHN